MASCKGIVLNTGKPCNKLSTDKGYCGRHQAQIFIEEAKTKNEVVCRHFSRGCRNYLTDDDKSKNITSCKECRSKILGKEKSCTHSGCSNKIIDFEEYCGKHYRDYYYKKAIKEKIRYCNIERGCNSVLESDEKVCKKCVEKLNTKIENELEEYRSKRKECLKCLKEKKQCGHFCKECIDEVQIIKDECGYRPLQEIWRDFCKGAASRSLYTTLTYEDYIKLIISPCYYCGKFSENRYNGIDRYYNNIGYTYENSKPCCSVCNFMKNVHNPDIFLRKISSIIQYQTFGKSDIEQLVAIYPELHTNYYTTFNSYKNNAIYRRKLEFSLEEKEFNDFKYGRCYICGLNHSEYHKNGIDRVDNSKGYTIDNCRSCCFSCNSMKLDHSLNEFINHCRQIVKYNKQYIESLPSLSLKIVSSSEEKERSFTAKEIYMLMEKEKLEQYIDWAKRNGKSSMFVIGIKSIDYKSLGKDDTVKEIQHQMELERTRSYKENTGKKITKHYTAPSVYALIMSGDKAKFSEWYERTYGLSKSFQSQLDELAEELPKQSQETGISLCKKFLQSEKSRRQSMNATAIKAAIEKPKTPLEPERKATNIRPVESIHKNEIVFMEEKPVPHTESLPISESSTHIESSCTDGPSKITLPKQWKANIIYDFIKSNKGSAYKAHCETSNEIPDKIKWENDWKLFETQITSADNFESAKSVISDFIVRLRSQRHTKILEKSRKDILERKDRSVWPKETVLKAWVSDKINTYKDFLEANDKELLVIRWPRFIKALENAKTDEEKLAEIEKFQTLLRTARYRSTKKEQN